MTLEEALHSNDMNEIIESMTAYVYGRIKTIGLKDLEGKNPEDFVGEVLMKLRKVKEIGLRQNVHSKNFYLVASEAICIISSNILNRYIKMKCLKLKANQNREMI